MIEFVFALAMAATSQDLALEPRRPMLECSEHLSDARARHNCLRDLLRDAERGLGTSLDAARSEAEETDLDSGGMFQAAQWLETAHQHWTTYRDAECSRRAALMILSEESRTDVQLDCQVAMTRARRQELEAN